MVKMKIIKDKNELNRIILKYNILQFSSKILNGKNYIFVAYTKK